TMPLDFYIERPVRKRLVQGFECWNPDALGPPRKCRTAIWAKPIARVETLQFCNGLLSYGSGAIGCPVDDCVMNDDDGAFGGCVYVALHDPTAQGKSFAEPLDRVLGHDLRPAAMGEVDWPAARSRRRRRHITLRC